LPDPHSQSTSAGRIGPGLIDSRPYLGSYLNTP
jgi:hypothetical protein